jgi:exosortase A-associated hydrolase 2
LSEDRLVPRFLGESGRRVFALLRLPAAAPRSCVLIVPPFAEEMNKTRKLMTDVAAALARRGVATLLVDLFGTGDSEGDFAQADWTRWHADLELAAAWSESEGGRVDGLLAVRLGCVLGAEFAQRRQQRQQRIVRSVFWQPVLDGSRFLDQLLRLRVAASMMEQDQKETTAGLRARLASGEALEIAGYSLSSALAAQLDAARLEQWLGNHLGTLEWIEVVRSAEAAAPVPSIKAAERARAQGLEVTLTPVPGEPFWSSVEIVQIPALVERTVATLEAAA